MDLNQLQSSNINSQWLGNIYENIKNLERMFRIAGNGFESIDAYIFASEQEKFIQMPDIQFTNLKAIVVEIGLLLDDLTPVLDETTLKPIYEELKSLKKEMKERGNYITETYNQKSRSSFLTSRNLRDKFAEDLDKVNEIKRDIILSIGHILYVKTDEKPKGMDKSIKGEIRR